MTSRALPFEITNILDKLEFISNIPPHHKVNIQDRTLQHKDSWIGAFRRTVRNVDRDSTLREIQLIIDETARVLKEFDQEPEYIRLVINAFRNAGRSIKKLGESVYSTDPSVMSQITVKNKSIQIYLDKYRDYLDPLAHIEAPKHNSTITNNSKNIIDNNDNIVNKTIVADLNLSDSDNSDNTNIYSNEYESHNYESE